MHHRGVLHRDIQLGNCVIGLPPNEKLVYMIDFGFSKRYIDPYTGRHIPDSKLKRDFIGNYWFRYFVIPYLPLLPVEIQTAQ
jgi:casein kinase 1